METTMIAGATLPAQTYMPDNDTALVQASRGGDVAAFEQLVKRYDAKLLSLMWPIGLQIPKCYTAHQSSAKFSSLLFKG